MEKPTFKNQPWLHFFGPLLNIKQLEDTCKTTALAYTQSICHPPIVDIFKSFEMCPSEELKIVLLGQDPYHGPGQAMGVAFSVPENCPLPPSLKNIFKEIQSDTCTELRKNGDLSDWATQGVLLLNSTLTVETGKAGSHQKIGWEEFTDSVIKIISHKKEHVVFLLWGNNAQAKRCLIDESKHLVLTAAHPSPLSAYRGFFGCKHFSQANEYLKSHNLKPIKW